MPLQIIDDVSKYRVVYNTSTDLNNYNLTSLDLLFEKGMLKTNSEKNVKYLFPIFRPYAILVRILFYSLMDYRELIGENEFKSYLFIDWLSSQKRYRNYLVLVWLTKKLKEIEKDNYFYKKFNCKLDIKSETRTSNLQDFNCFDLINVEEYKRSTLKNYTMNKSKIKAGLYLLGNSVFLDILDKSSVEDIPVNQLPPSSIRENMKTVEYIKLNKAFFLAERRIKLDNWLF